MVLSESRGWLIFDNGGSRGEQLFQVDNDVIFSCHLLGDSMFVMSLFLALVEELFLLHIS